jgi:hypothetical protein
MMRPQRRNAMFGRDAFHRVPEIFPRMWEAVERVPTPF